MQRIFNVDRWVVIEPGQILDYPSERPRLVRVEVNSPGPACLYLIDANQESYFLAKVDGRDTIEFISPGAFGLTVDSGVCSVYTVDGTSAAHVVEAPVSFTKIVERRRRNPELEYIAAQMSANMQRMLEAQSAEREAVYQRRERERDDRAKAAIAAAKSLSSDDGAKSEPAGAVASTSDAEASGSGREPASGGGKRK